MSALSFIHIQTKDFLMPDVPVTRKFETKLPVEMKLNFSPEDFIIFANQQTKLFIYQLLDNSCLGGLATFLLASTIGALSLQGLLFKDWIKYVRLSMLLKEIQNVCSTSLIKLTMIQWCWCALILLVVHDLFVDGDWSRFSRVFLL